MGPCSLFCQFWRAVDCSTCHVGQQVPGKAWHVDLCLSRCALHVVEREALLPDMTAWEAQLRSRLDKNPWHANSWETLVEEVAPPSSPPSKIVQTRALFEEVLAKFPTAANYWKRYAEAEMAAGNQSQVKAIFNRCLLNCPSVPLWTSYLSFIKKVNDAKGSDGLGEVRKSYEYTLDRIGSSMEAGPLWQEYITFLQGPSPGSPAYNALFPAAGAGVPAGQDDSHRITVVRRAYQRAIGMTTSQVDQLWRAYEAFENSGSNPQFTQRVLAEHRPRYTAARTALNELRSRMSRIKTAALAVPPGKGGPFQTRQAQAWADLLQWEKSNPQNLDGPALSARVSLTFDEALCVLMHFPDVWYSYSRWHATEGGSGPAAAAQVLDRSTKALPSCTLLHYAAADLKEGEGNVAEAETVYSALAAKLLSDGQTGALGEAAAPEKLELSSEEGTLFWIRYMRFLRRNDGVAASRKVFVKATKWPQIGWQVFAHSAQMEWFSEHNDKVPRNIYELGLKSFAKERRFISAYATFLLSQGDVDNARQLFERCLAEADQNKELWDSYLEFESKHGTLATLRALEQRRSEARGEASAVPSDALHVMLLEHRDLGLWPCSELQKEHLKRLPPELGQFISSLPSANPLAYSLAPPPVDTVIEVLMRTDLSPEAVAAAMGRSGLLGAGPGMPLPTGGWTGQKRPYEAVGGLPAEALNGLMHLGPAAKRQLL
ncbi:hypothetical protein WJX73_000969 [Symbiochloris irregularis]|uniref:Suppressor of forked domain-containing protein n=1 Tax=Symbiochloris irregularis TaxID=706552 RepID=A0AAW1NLF0_9CHLO